jgi:hypothetical protein
MVPRSSTLGPTTPVPIKVPPLPSTMAALMKPVSRTEISAVPWFGLLGSKPGALAVSPMPARIPDALSVEFTPTCSIEWPEAPTVDMTTRLAVTSALRARATVPVPRRPMDRLPVVSSRAPRAGAPKAPMPPSSSRLLFEPAA